MRTIIVINTVLRPPSTEPAHAGRHDLRYVKLTLLAYVPREPYADGP